MSGGRQATELEAAARRLAALADRIRAVRAQLGGGARPGEAAPGTGQAAPEPADRPKDQAH
ncbi:MAG TPA: hypothetical protein VN962_04120 [Polyangia bacterium]|nr:hypothetical protein [Polyangia bacterium]